MKIRQAPKHSAGIVAMVVQKNDPRLLQDFLVARFQLSRRTAKAMIDGRNVWVDRRCVWIARYELHTGASVEVPEAVVKGARAQKSATATPSAADSAVSPAKNLASAQPQRHVRVIWRNENYLVADKPAGLLSCDDPKSVESILRVQEAIPTLEAVHRLDRDTSGCLLFAVNHAALTAAIEMFKTHKVSKTYHAISLGEFRFPRLRIDTPLDGENAVSFVSRESVGEDASFLRVRIETGRTNQIRRHLASVRAPIVGDRVFGLKNARDPRLMQVPRQMLHASTLILPDPLCLKNEIRAHSPLPADFRATLKLFGMGR